MPNHTQLQTNLKTIGLISKVSHDSLKKFSKSRWSEK